LLWLRACIPEEGDVARVDAISAGRLEEVGRAAGCTKAARTDQCGVPIRLNEPHDRGLRAMAPESAADSTTCRVGTAGQSRWQVSHAGAKRSPGGREPPFRGGSLSCPA
jgi:hypothetical protein